MSSEWKTIGFFPLVGWVNTFKDGDTEPCPGVILQEIEGDPYTDHLIRLVFATLVDDGELFPVDSCPAYSNTTTVEESRFSQPEKVSSD